MFACFYCGSKAKRTNDGRCPACGAFDPDRVPAATHQADQPQSRSLTLEESIDRIDIIRPARRQTDLDMKFYALRFLLGFAMVGGLLAVALYGGAAVASVLLGGDDGAEYFKMMLVMFSVVSIAKVVFDANGLDREA